MTKNTETAKKKEISSWEDLEGIKSTAEIAIPSDPLDRVLGQEEAIALAKVAAKQRRHLLLVGPPGTGKSMIAQAISLHLPAPSHEVRVVNNPENPERPILEVVEESYVLEENISKAGAMGELLEPERTPTNVAERLGYLCKGCHKYSIYTERTCPHCNRSKTEMG
ncbi:MAG: ATP-binding protein, partial [Methanomassiliicoccaceae archaeon]|nr:ATP-binding protein [Methanomassiliicoccaceae archaeon]